MAITGVYNSKRAARGVTRGVTGWVHSNSSDYHAHVYAEWYGDSHAHPYGPKHDSDSYGSFLFVTGDMGDGVRRSMYYPTAF